MMMLPLVVDSIENVVMLLTACAGVESVNARSEPSPSKEERARGLGSLCLSVLRAYELLT